MYQGFYNQTLQIQIKNVPISNTKPGYTTYFQFSVTKFKFHPNYVILYALRIVSLVYIKLTFL